MQCSIKFDHAIDLSQKEESYIYYIHTKILISHIWEECWNQELVYFLTVTSYFPFRSNSTLKINNPEKNNMLLSHHDMSGI